MPYLASGIYGADALSLQRECMMKSVAVGEFKAQFSSIMKELQEGHPITITYGKKRTKLDIIGFNQN